MRRFYSSRRFKGLKDDRDRIEKAVALINGCLVSPQSEGIFIVHSDTRNKSFRTTLVSCECEDFQFNTGLCKHQWASWGAAAALLIMHVRRAMSARDLELCAAFAADDLTGVPEPFLAVVREEYRKRLKDLYEANHKARTA